MTDDFLTFKYEQADRKHRTGQKLTEDEWEALLAGERAKQTSDEDLEDTIRERESEIEKLEREVSDLEDEIDDLRHQVSSLEDDLKAARGLDD